MPIPQETNLNYKNSKEITKYLLISINFNEYIKRILNLFKFKFCINRITEILLKYESILYQYHITYLVLDILHSFSLLYLNFRNLSIKEQKREESTNQFADFIHVTDYNLSKAA